MNDNEKKPDDQKPDDQFLLPLREIKRQQMLIKQSLPNQAGQLNERELQSLRGVEQNLGQVASQITNLQTELMQLRMLAKTWGMINSSLDINTVLSKSIEQVIELTGAERGYILWKKQNQQTGQAEFQVVSSMEQDPNDREFQISHTIVNKVMESGEPLLTENATQDDKVSGSVSVQNLNLRSVLCVPLKQNTNEVFGVVYVANRMRIGLFTDRELRLMTAFADQASIAIENARVFTIVKTQLQRANKEMEKLRIDINENQKSRQVSEIVDTEYFRTLQSKAREMRQNRNGEGDGGR